MEVSTDNFETEVMEADKPVLVDFWAPWCSPCRMLKPVLEELVEESGDEYKVAKVNVDDNRELAMKFQIMGIPTIILFRQGQEVARASGVKNKEFYKKMLMEGN